MQYQSAHMNSENTEFYHLPPMLLGSCPPPLQYILRNASSSRVESVTMMGEMGDEGADMTDDDPSCTILPPGDDGVDIREQR